LDVDFTDAVTIEVPRKDMLVKATGDAKFPQGVRLYVRRVKHPSEFGTKLAFLDTAYPPAVEGIKAAVETTSLAAVQCVAALESV
jgi:hypothetical protein